MNLFGFFSRQASGWAGPRQWLMAAGLGLAALAAAAADDPPGRVGRIGETRGQVWMMEGGQGEWFDLQRNRPFTTGDRVATDQGGRAQLEVGSTTLRLSERSDLQIMRLDDDRIELLLNAGSLALSVREGEVARELQVETADGRFSPRTPGLFRIDLSDKATFASAATGELQFDAPDSSLTLRPGQRAEFWQDDNDHATHYSWASPVNDEFDQWARRDDVRVVRPAANPYVSPEMTGAGDLDQYGQWATDAEYGAIWTPSSVAVGWAPYRYGRWAWVSPWGWTWVDDAPWGFAPFHYGRWVHWHGRWGWAPGRFERRPVYAPAMVAWVGGSRFNLSVNIGGGPAVGWIPLAPREAYYPVYRSSPVYIEKINLGHVHVPQGRMNPPGPVAYTNRGVPGGITVVPANALSQRQPVAVAARRASDDVVQRAMRDERHEFVAPPAPVGAPMAPRVVPTPRAVFNAPRPPVAGLPAAREDRLQQRNQGDARREFQRGDADTQRQLPVRPVNPQGAVPVTPQAAPPAAPAVPSRVLPPGRSPVEAPPQRVPPQARPVEPVLPPQRSVVPQPQQPQQPAAPEAPQRQFTPRPQPQAQPPALPEVPQRQVAPRAPSDRVQSEERPRMRERNQPAAEQHAVPVAPQATRPAQAIEPPNAQNAANDGARAEKRQERQERRERRNGND